MKKEIVVTRPKPEHKLFQDSVKLTLNKTNVKITNQCLYLTRSIDRDSVLIDIECLDDVIKALQDLKRLTTLG